MAAVKYTYRCEYVRCNKADCGTCPHGPYWYGYYRDGKRVKKRYFGLSDPRREGSTYDPMDAVFSRATCTHELCCRILGVPYNATAAMAESAYFKAIAANHPDRGGDAKWSAQLNAAWTWLKFRHGW